MGTVLDTMTRWFHSPDVQAAVRQAVRTEEEQRLETRHAAARELQELEAQHAAARAVHEQERSAAACAVAAAQVALDAATRQYRVLVTQFETEQKWPLELQIEARRRQLRATVSPLLKAFLEELREEIAHTYAQRDVVTRPSIENWPIVVWNNHASVVRRVEAIRELMPACEENGSLVYEPLSDVELAERLAAMRASLPAVEARPVEYAEVLS